MLAERNKSWIEEGKHRTNSFFAVERWRLPVWVWALSENQHQRAFRPGLQHLSAQPHPLRTRHLQFLLLSLPRVLAGQVSGSPEIQTLSTCARCGNTPKRSSKASRVECFRYGQKKYKRKIKIIMFIYPHRCWTTMRTALLLKARTWRYRYHALVRNTIVCVFLGVLFLILLFLFSSRRNISTALVSRLETFRIPRSTWAVTVELYYQ